MVFIIEKANRSKAKVVLALAGDSGTGKTLSAIRLARGIVGAEGKIGFVDTEQHRASLYADYYGGFDVINLEPPFSPERYAEAVLTFKDAGYDCVIIDSMSHEWEGDGGVLEMAENQVYKSGKKMTGMDKWVKPKMAHRKMMSNLMNCGMNIIFCYRVKYQLVDAKDEKGNDIKVRSTDATIVREQGVNYDITCELELHQNKIPYVAGKCPEALEWMFGKEMANETMGANIVEWLHTKQRDADAIVAEGSKQKDLKAWYMGLNKFEQYLAKKYNAKIKQGAESNPVVIEKQEPKQENVEFENVEDL